MSGPGTDPSLPDCVAGYLDALPFPGRDLTDAEAAAGQRCLEIIKQNPGPAVPAILDRMREGDLTIHNVCYRLLASLGPPASEALREALGQRDPGTDIWVVGALRQRGDLAASDALGPLLDHRNAEVRELAALALALVAVEDGSAAPTRVLERLADAVGSDRTVLGSPFRVADSALACLSRLGAPGLPLDEPVPLHNDQHFAFPPPGPPLPLAPTVWTGTPDEIAALRSVIRDWVTSVGR